MVRQLWEQNTDVVLVDTGNSYEGLCDYVNGKYISYTEEHPITMNPFAINREELNIEKIGFLKNLIMLIWKGTNGKITKTEDHLIEDVITEYYDAHFRLGKVRGLLCNFANKFAKSGCASAKNKFSALGLHRLCHPIKFQTSEVYEEINFYTEPIDGIIP